MFSTYDVEIENFASNIHNRNIFIHWLIKKKWKWVFIFFFIISYVSFSLLIFHNQHLYCSHHCVSTIKSIYSICFIHFICGTMFICCIHKNHKEKLYRLWSFDSSIKCCADACMFFISIVFHFLHTLAKYVFLCLRVFQWKSFRLRYIHHFQIHIEQFEHVISLLLSH